MMLVPTFVAASPIHGLGLFAAERIAAGTKIWAFQEGIDVVIPDAALARLPRAARDFITWYGFRSEFWPGGLVLGFDHSRFINHSDEPNTDNGTEFAFALRDIAKGEEITADYREVCSDFARDGWGAAKAASATAAD
jgi:SET domain-containing protein